MTRLPFAAILLAVAGAAAPAAAQPVPPAPAPGGERIQQAIVFGDDACPPAQGDEIVVCAKLPEGDRYRIPQIFRQYDPNSPRNEAWTNRVVALERIGRFGTDSCSPVGAGGFTGCMGQMIAGAYIERAATDKVSWDKLIAEERGKRLAGIDAASAEVEAAVVAAERELAERQRRDAELEERGGAPAPDAAATATGPDAPLPAIPPRRP